MKRRRLPCTPPFGKGFPAALLILSLLLIPGRQAVRAGEKDGMPSERASREHRFDATGTDQSEEILVDMLQIDEDRLLLNGEAFVMKPETRIEDTEGRRISLDQIPSGAKIEVRYRTGPGLEGSGCARSEKLLLRIRLLEEPRAG